MCFSENGVVEKSDVQRVEKSGVQRMKVRFDRDTFQNEILRHPFPQLIVVVKNISQLFRLEKDPSSRECCRSIDVPFERDWKRTDC